MDYSFFDLLFYSCYYSFHSTYYSFHCTSLKYNIIVTYFAKFKIIGGRNWEESGRPQNCSFWDQSDYTYYSRITLRYLLFKKLL